MGMPRYISKKYKVFYESLFFNKEGVYKAMAYAFYSGVQSAQNKKIREVGDIRDEKFLQDRIKFTYKIEKKLYSPEYKNVQDKLSKCNYAKYIGLKKRNGKWVSKHVSVKVSKFILSKIMKIDSTRERIDREKMELMDKILAVQNRVYSSRLFPPKIKQIIFEKDNYTCQQCGKNKETLIGIGLHLECHHIIAWEDGGETTYKNGQTVCSECNKGIHYAKSYLNSKETLINNVFYEN